tara:strand:- start:906 stop:1112 length:207 start_codon:yes stop_codon:yes gene_type:complete
MQALFKSVHKNECYYKNQSIGVRMSVVLNTARYWLIESGFGTFVEISREEFPTLISALAEARRQLIDG